LFARKSLSWTHLFTEMEKIVPAGLHVVSMKPEYTKTNDLMIHVIVATDSRERAVELVRKMETSPRLRQAQIVAETVVNNNTTDPAAGGGNIQFDIAALYVPGAMDSDETAQPAPGAPAASNTPKPVAAPAPAPQNTARNQPVAPVQARQH